MNNETTDPDQADEEILITTVSDETLETAAGTEAGERPALQPPSDQPLTIAADPRRHRRLAEAVWTEWLLLLGRAAPFGPNS